MLFELMILLKPSIKNTILTADAEILIEAIFVEDNKFIFLAVRHFEGRYGKDYPPPGKLAYFSKGQNEASVRLVNRELVGFVGQGGIVKI